MFDKVYTDLLLTKAVDQNIYTGTVGTSSTQVTLTNAKGYKAVRVGNFNESGGKILHFSYDGGTNWFYVPRNSERIFIAAKDTIYLKSNLSGCRYEIEVLENK